MAHRELRAITTHAVLSTVAIAVISGVVIALDFILSTNCGLLLPPDRVDSVRTLLSVHAVLLVTLSLGLITFNTIKVTAEIMNTRCQYE